MVAKPINGVSGARVYLIEQTNPKDTRGETWLWRQNSAQQMMICRRKKGATSCHFHRGEDPSKSPEWLFIAQGKVQFNFFLRRKSNGGTEDVVERGEIIVEAGTMLSIDPHVIHKTVVLEDAVILESRRTLFDPNRSDTFPAEIPEEAILAISPAV